jgi:hypothetical protein
LPPENWQAFNAWRDGAAERLATIAAKQNQITALYGALVTTTKGQDLPLVYTTGTNVNEYIKHIMSFADAVKQDYADLIKYKSEIQALELEINALNAVDEGLAKKFGASLLDVRRQSAPGYMTEMEQALLQTARTQVELLNAQVVYLDAIDAKSKEMLNGWDSVKAEAKKELIIGSIAAALNILAQTGKSGMAFYKLYDGDWKVLKDSTKRNVSHWWEILGLRPGQIADYVSDWMNAGRFLDGLHRHGITSEQAGYDFVTGKIEEMSGPNGNFQILTNRLNEHLKWAQEEDERRGNSSPNPFIPV